MEKIRYDGLDILKAFCALCIVFIHIPISGVVGEYIVALSRIAVPIFFMITGFFYEDTIKKKKEKLQIKKILYLILISSILYGGFKITLAAFKGNFSDCITNMFSIKSIFKFFIFNESMFYMHLWYLNAILYVLIICYFFRKFTINWKKILYILTPFLLLGDLVFGKYSILLFGKQIPFIIVRNFLFVGIPYFSIGMFLNEKQLYKKSENIKKSIFIILLFLILNIVERYVLVKYDINAVRDHYLTTTFLAVVLFNIFSNICWNKFNLDFVKKIGRNYSMVIYIIHPIFIWIINKVLVFFKLERIFKNFEFSIVYLLSILFAVVYYKLKENVLIKLNDCKKKI